jgi:CRP/FNR family transcriptional regulator
MSILNSVELFGSLNDAERNTLSLYCQERLIREGEILFHEGDDAVALYVVKQGSLKVYKDRSSGEIFLGNIGPGELAGEMALFDLETPKKRIASIQATEDSLLLVIMDYAILELSKKHPEIYGKIAEIIIKRKTIAL